MLGNTFACKRLEVLLMGFAQGPCIRAVIWRFADMYYPTLSRREGIQPNP
jgi:hypothetical protein